MKRRKKRPRVDLDEVHKRLVQAPPAQPQTIPVQPMIIQPFPQPISPQPPLKRERKPPRESKELPPSGQVIHEVRRHLEETSKLLEVLADFAPRPNPAMQFMNTEFGGAMGAMVGQFVMELARVGIEDVKRKRALRERARMQARQVPQRPPQRPPSVTREEFNMLVGAMQDMNRKMEKNKMEKTTGESFEEDFEGESDETSTG